MAKREKVKVIFDHYPFVIVGGFFEWDYVDDVSAHIAECLRVPVFLEELFNKFDFSNHPEYLKNVISICSSAMKVNHKQHSEDHGYYIGIPITFLPEHISIKRASIDVRNLFIDMRILQKDAHPDSVALITKVVNDVYEE